MCLSTQGSYKATNRALLCSKAEKPLWLLVSRQSSKESKRVAKRVGLEHIRMLFDMLNPCLERGGDVLI